jgi:hypothetical protein
VSTEERVVFSDEVDFRRPARWTSFVELTVFLLEFFAILCLYLWSEGPWGWIVVLVALEHLAALTVAFVVTRRDGARSMEGTSAAGDPAGQSVLVHCILAAWFGMAYVLISLLPCDWIEAQLAASTLSGPDADDAADTTAS